MVKKEKGKLYDDETESILAQYYVRLSLRRWSLDPNLAGIIPLDPLHDQR